MKKKFVIDTNVILHDSSCVFHFEDNDVIIPITVIEELDAFKRGRDQIHFNAREFIRFLDQFRGDKIINGGENLGEGRGKILILTNYGDDPDVKQAFVEYKPDHRILSAALHLKKSKKREKIIVVSKDVNLRLKAKSLGLEAQDYYTDKIEDIEKLYRGLRLIEGFPPDAIDRLYRDSEVPLAETDIQDTIPNEYFILRNNNKSALAYYNPMTKMLQHVEKGMAYGIKPRNAEQTFALHALMNSDAPLVTLSGKAGTGKTLLALAAALERRKVYKQIYLARPIVALSNKDLGYLPGDVEAKLDPYMQPLYDNLGVIKNQFKESDRNYLRIQEMLDSDKLLIAPLAFIRGRSLNNIYFIVDEAQNLTPHEVKTIITRAGEGTKVVFNGDPYQIDTPYLDSRSTGLSYLIDRMKGQPLYAHVTMQKGERSELAELASDLL
ncbi:PhoH family protein [candidate division KSB1 bacterium]|nr:PhoH family protein [candidate division KSB1 bacterium]RQW04833.1 MAG: PhoH family protein [candidate division KSB1 bacterium]